MSRLKWFMAGYFTGIAVMLILSAWYTYWQKG